MGILVLVLLVTAWGLVLGPALLRSSQDPSPLRTEKMFRRALKAIGSERTSSGAVGGRWVLVPPSGDYPSDPHVSGNGRAGGRMTAAERRRRNLTWLAGFIVATFLLGLIPALRFLLVLNLVADILLIAYLGAALYFAARPLETRGSRERSRSEGEAGRPTTEAASGGGW